MSHCPRVVFYAIILTPSARLCVQKEKYMLMTIVYAVNLNTVLLHVIR